VFAKTKYVSSCPAEYTGTETARLCTEAPASFVYSITDLSAFIWESFGYPLSSSVNTLGIKQTRAEFAYKYRNSYCATCYGAWQLGCDLRKSYETNDQQKYDIWWQGYPPLVFKYILDLNNRTCSRDSDYYLMYPDRSTGRDLCDKLTEELRSCNCSEIFDIGTQTCVPAALPVNHVCKSESYQEVPLTPSSYMKTCAPQYHYGILGPNERAAACDACRGGKMCQEVVEARYNYSLYLSPAIPNKVQIEDNIYCATNLFTPRCGLEAVSNRSCYRGMGHHGMGTGLKKENPADLSILLNSIVISHYKTVFSVEIKVADSIKESGFKVMFSSSMEDFETDCVAYNVTQAKFEFCPNHELRSEDGVVYSDFNVQADGIKVCTKLSQLVYELEYYDYAFVAISLLCIFSYNLHYLIKKEYTVTGNIVFSSLCTQFLALLTYAISHIDIIIEVPSVCPVLAMLKQYLFISMICWTNALAIWIARGVTQTELASQRSARSFLWCALHGWVSPLVFVILTICLQYGPTTIFYPVLTDGSPCFLHDTSYVRLLVFLVPIYLIILINFLFAVSSMVAICRGTQASEADRERHVKNIMIVLKLVFLFGLHWVLLFLADYVMHAETQAALWTTVRVLTEFQGCLVILAQSIKLVHMRKAFKSLTSTMSGLKSASIRGSKKSSYSLELSPSNSGDTNP